MLKIFKNFRKRPNASECFRAHPNVSEHIREGPNRSKHVSESTKTSKNLQKLRENFAETSRKLRERRVRAVVVLYCLDSLICFPAAFVNMQDAARASRLRLSVTVLS